MGVLCAQERAGRPGRFHILEGHPVLVHLGFAWQKSRVRTDSLTEARKSANMFPNNSPSVLR